MMKPSGALWRFALSGVFALLVFIVIVNLLRQPIAATTRSYTAEFTDVAGLYLDSDVRVRGVRVGKVQSVSLERKSGQSLAAVEFSLDKRFAVVPGTRLAIKYQVLTGARYIDVVSPSEDPNAQPLTRVPTNMTQPSFDVTTLFNGLQPVLATLSPDDIDKFTSNAAAYLAGDGSGLGPMLESIRTLTSFVSDRQQVISTLMRNLDAVAGELGGHSKQFVQILDWLNRPIDGALTVLDEFRKSELYGPGFTSAAVNLLHNLGFKPGADLDAGLDRAVTVFDDWTDAVKRVPVMWDNIQPPAPPGVPLPCSHGPAQLPEFMDVLLNGQKVILCNH
ncbi:MULTISPECIES: MlaD family protein [Mycolicibacterium]|uniref:MlaD family protein n=1 Tax=Mycolicibacterium TaxID=1866885 RepID=UPI0008490BBD|nr:MULTISPECIES: MlaD family protein [Mycolicibacterium]ODR24878.1 mammalian cell entry protein [Mycolicibacterium porcinum]